MLDLSRAMREASTDTLSPGTWIAQLRQLQSGVTQLITTIVNAQIDPEPRLELLSQTLGWSLLARHAAGAGRHRPHRSTPARRSCSPSSASRAPPSTVSPSELGDSEPSIADPADRQRRAIADGPDRQGTTSAAPRPTRSTTP